MQSSYCKLDCLCDAENDEYDGAFWDGDVLMRDAEREGGNEAMVRKPKLRESHQLSGIG